MTIVEQFEFDVRTPQEDVLVEAELVFPRLGVYQSEHTIPTTAFHRMVLFAPAEDLYFRKSYSASVEVRLGINAVTATVTNFKDKFIPDDSIKPTGILLRGHLGEWVEAVHPEINDVDGYEAVIDNCSDSSVLRAIMPDGERITVPAVSPVVPEYLAKRAIWELADDVKTGMIDFSPEE